MGSLLHILGIDTATGPWYAFWSGIGADLGELAVIGGLIALYRRHNCHVQGCWHIGHLPVEGTPWVVCRWHSPGGKPTHADILAAHRRHRSDEKGRLDG
jgi:hypothetical protein